MFNIISPDGFNISMENFPSKEEAWAYFNEWIKRFEHQGYYSMSNRQRIKLDEVKEWCTEVTYVS